jgi:hypothetical protein
VFVNISLPHCTISNLALPHQPYPDGNVYRASGDRLCHGQLGGKARFLSRSSSMSTRRRVKRRAEGVNGGPDARDTGYLSGSQPRTRQVPGSYYSGGPLDPAE